jgi:hypothetical protein
MYFAVFSPDAAATGHSPRLTMTDGALVWAVDFDHEHMDPKLRKCVMRERGETDIDRLKSFVKRLSRGIDSIVRGKGFACALQVRSTALDFTLTSAVTKHEFELRAEDSASKRREAIVAMMYAQSDRGRKQQAMIASLDKKKKTLDRHLEEARALAEEKVEEREKEAQEQLSCFVLLLNEKKREIRRLRARGADERAADGGGRGGGGGGDGGSGGDISDGDSTSCDDDDANQKRARGGGGSRSPTAVRIQGRPQAKRRKRRASRKSERVEAPAAAAVPDAAAARASASAPARRDIADQTQAVSESESDDLLGLL